MGRRWVGRAVLAAAAAAVAAATACAPGAAAALRAGAAPRGSVGAPRPVAARAAGGGGSADADAVAEPAGHRSIPRLEIDLDQAPEDRYRPLFAPGLAFNATLWRFYETCFAHDPPLRDALYALSRVRGDEPEEMMAEIAGVAALSGLDVEFVKATQMLYELQTLMVPWENFTYPDAHLGSLVPGGEAVATAPLARIPWRGPGCTGIVAKCADGTVWHARNLDFSPRDIVAGLIYEGVFTRGGKELFRSQVVAGYLQVITASVMGDDGYVLERNTRYPDHAGGNGEMLRNLLGGRPLNGWVLRKILESEKTFDGAIQAITDAQYVSTEYAIVSGVGKGHVLARDPDHVAHVQTLGETLGEERGDYIIMTNFDWFYGDVREYFDPTAGGGFGKLSRRQRAQQLLNAVPQGQLTADVLFEIINAELVVAKDTIFQLLADVEKGVWNASQPAAATARL